MRLATNRTMTARRVMHAAGGAVHFTYPPEWSVHAYHGLDLLEFYPLADRSVYGPGIAALISAETGSALEAILPLGLFLLTRDLSAPRIAHDGWQSDAQRAWYHLCVEGRVRVPAQGRAAGRSSV